MSAPNEAPSRPWYRHVWPWMLMLPPAAAMAFWAVILSTMASPPALVVDDYAKIGLSYAEDRSRDAAAGRLGVSARLRADRSSGHVSLHLTEAGEWPQHLQLRLTHPTDAARDRLVPLTRNAAGIYQGSMKGALTGRRHVLLEPADRSWRLSGELPAEAESLQLHPKQAVSGS